jgi:DNA ligase-1
MNKRFETAIAEAEKIPTKKEKHAALSGLDAEGEKLVWNALNPYRVFRTKKWDEPKQYASKDPDSYQNFLDLLDSLHNKDITGNVARFQVSAILSQFTKTTASYLARVIKKDLKCGADRTTFEELYPNMAIPEFLQGLAAKIDEGPKAKYQWTFPCIADGKYDGYRLIAYVEDGVIEYYSRGGKLAEYARGLFDDELIALEKLFGRPVAVDGEAYARTFQESAEAKGAKNEEARKHLKFNVFDIMSKEEWLAKSCPFNQISRLMTIDTLIKQGVFTRLVKSKYRIIHSKQEAYDFLSELDAEGEITGILMEEGLIIKQIDGLYDWDPDRKSMVWAKYKPVMDVDVKITGFRPGNKNTKNEHILGAIEVEGFDENSNKIKCKCGGFKVKSPKAAGYVKNLAISVGMDLKALKMSEDQFLRTYIWEHKELFLGKTVMIEGQMLSKAKGSDTWAIRFPQFIMVRDDK